MPGIPAWYGSEEVPVVWSMSLAVWSMSLLPQASAAPPPMSAGTHAQVLSVDGVERRFTVQLPAGLEGAEAKQRPVVLALHYAGHGAPDYAAGFVEVLVGPGLGDLGAIVVAPDCPAGARWIDAAGERVALAVLDHAIATWGGDASRVVLTGFSMGGIGAWHLAARHPERFAAVVPVAGSPRASDVAALQRSKLPVHAIHGTRDEVIPPAASRAAVEALAAAGVEAVWAPVDLSHYETGRYRSALWAAVPWIRERLARIPSVRAPSGQGTSETGSRSSSGR
jgi:dipeptidyl aminopeptidase/acylaminoacyl peptidase